MSKCSLTETKSGKGGWAALSIVVAAACMLSFGCGKKSEAVADKAVLAPVAQQPVVKPEVKSTKLTYASSKNAWCVLPIIAKKTGIFERHGLNVELQYVQAAKQAMDALVGGAADVANVVEINVAFLGFSGEKNVSVIATICESYDGAIIARKDKGIAKPADLAGKKVGILQGTTSQVFADRFMKANGVDSKGVTIINLQPVAIQASILNGEIDAGSVWEPFTHNIVQQLGDKCIVFSDRDAYTGYMNAAVRKDWLAKNADVAKSLIQSLAEAEIYVTEHKDQAIDIVSTEINLPKETLQKIWESYKYDLYLSPAKLTDTIKKEGEWVKGSQERFHDKDLPDYAGYADPSVLSAVVPSKVK